MLKLLPKVIEDIIIEYKEEMEIHIKKTRLLNQLKKRYKYEYNEDGFSDVKYKNKEYFYSNEKCVDGIRRFKTNFINPKFITGINYDIIGNLQHTVCFTIEDGFIEEYYECKGCWCLNCDGCNDSDSESESETIDLGFESSDSE